MKTCPTCKQQKPFSAFHKNRATKDGYQWHCIDCRQAIDSRPAKLAQDRARYHSPAGKAAWRDSNYRRTYGISLADFNAMLDGQNGCCAICRAQKPGGKGTWHVDHSHSSGEVRGLLCANCNVLLGLAADSPDRLDAAATYLRRFK